MKSDITVQIKTFGGFSITSQSQLGQRTISEYDRSSRKCWMLIEYLVLNRDRPVPRVELAEALWPGGEIDNPLNTLKTLVHRARALLAPLGAGKDFELIVLTAGKYGWNPHIPLEVDCEEFDRLIALADAVKDTDPAATLEHGLAAAALYQGHFLPKTSGELWVSERASAYHSAFCELCCRVSQPAIDAGRVAELVELLQRAVVIEPYEERLHVWLIRALIASGDRKEAAMHYNSTTEMLFTRLGAAPSDDLTQLYRELAKSENMTELNLDVVRSKLLEQDTAGGAFYCEYEIFREIFQLEARSCARSGKVVQLSMISILEGHEKPLTVKQLRVAMERLRDTIGSTLRMGDAYARYSANQYLLMLPSASLEDANAVTERVMRNFRRAYPKTNAILHHSTVPMPPRMQPSTP